MGTAEKVPRPQKKTPYQLYFATASAKKGWRDVAAVRRNDLAKAWDFLSHTPVQKTPLSYPLRGELSTVSWRGKLYDRWQLKLSPTDGIRLWYFVHGTNVYLEHVHTHHPNQTK
jgi:hypothetical protein